MAILFMIGMALAIIVIDILIRVVIWKWGERRTRLERQKALDVGLRLDFTDEAPSLKRVQLEHPRARILAVDDEPVVLDSFRKILVYANYEIETVETGKEALGLIQRHDYDFVFTDLKMPEMDGLEVLKAVKHLRPDIDVIMITGYATIESAVEAMKHGGMDYVQKPFTEDELVEFVNKCLIRRQDRIEREKPPVLRLVTPSEGELGGRNVYNIPAGVFFSQGHTWVSIETNGLARVGIDDFINKIIGPIDEIVLPKVGQKVSAGKPLFSLVQQPNVLEVVSPINGTIRRVNQEILERIDLLRMKPYELGWICSIEPVHLAEDLKTLRIGSDAMAWYEDELRQYEKITHDHGPAEAGGEPAVAGQGRFDPETWALIASTFMKGRMEPPGGERLH